MYEGQLVSLQIFSFSCIFGGSFNLRGSLSEDYAAEIFEVSIRCCLAADDQEELAK